MQTSAVGEPDGRAVGEPEKGQHLIAMAASISFLKDAPVSATSPATAAAPSANRVVLDACPALTPPLSITHITWYS